MAKRVSGPASPNPEESSFELTEESIHTRAYQIYEARGREDGHAIDDWLLAEAEILGKKESAPTKQEQPPTMKSKGKRTAA